VFISVKLDGGYHSSTTAFNDDMGQTPL
jgi:hypothetical protein